MNSDEVRRSVRNRQPRLPYTPTGRGSMSANHKPSNYQNREIISSNNDSSTENPRAMHQNTVITMPYTKNRKRAAKKKVEASERPFDINIELKHHNIILEFNAGAYECFKATLHRSLKTTNTIIASKDDQNNLRDEDSISVLDNNGVQIYRINCYHGTSRVMVNGDGYVHFLEVVLPAIISDLDTNPQFRQINEQIRNFFSQYIAKPNDHGGKINTSSTASTPIRCLTASSENHDESTMHSDKMSKSVNQTKSKINQSVSASSEARPRSTSKQTNIATANDNQTAQLSGQTQRAYCAACTEECIVKSVECSKCEYWLHYECENIPPEEIALLVANENQDYICNGCAMNTDFIDMESVRNTTDSLEPSTDPKDTTAGNYPPLATNTKSKTYTESITSSVSGSSNRQSTPNNVVPQRPNIEGNKSNQSTHRTRTNALKTTGPVQIPQRPVSRHTPTAPYMVQHLEDESNSATKLLKEKEVKIKKLESDLTQCKKQLSTARAFTTNLENKYKDLEESNRILKTKLLLAEDLSHNGVHHPQQQPHTCRSAESSQTEDRMKLWYYEQRVHQLELENVKTSSRIDKLEAMLYSNQQYTLQNHQCSSINVNKRRPRRRNNERNKGYQNNRQTDQNVRIQADKIENYANESEYDVTPNSPDIEHLSGSIYDETDHMDKSYNQHRSESFLEMSRPMNKPPWSSPKTQKPQENLIQTTMTPQMHNPRSPQMDHKSSQLRYESPHITSRVSDQTKSTYNH